MTDLLRRCIEAATHAPSEHYVQPWRFEVADGVVELHADGARALPASDPDGRELVVSCGAALYALRLAMRCAGREPVTVLLPEGPSSSLLARVAPGETVVPDGDDLARYDAVFLRHSDRGPLDALAMTPEVPFLLQQAAEAQGATLRLLAAPGFQQTLAALVGRAERVWSRDPARLAELRAHRTAVARGVEVLRPSAGRVDRPLPAVLWTPEDRVVDWLRAGLALEAVLLRATVLGVAASFLNEPLEVPALRAELRDDLALPGFPQLVLRLGVGAGVPGVPSPRRPVPEAASDRL